MLKKAHPYQVFVESSQRYLISQTQAASFSFRAAELQPKEGSAMFEQPLTHRSCFGFGNFG